MYVVLFCRHKSVGKKGNIKAGSHHVLKVPCNLLKLVCYFFVGQVYSQRQCQTICPALLTVSDLKLQHLKKQIAMLSVHGSQCFVFMVHSVLCPQDFYVYSNLTVWICKSKAMSCFTSHCARWTPKNVPQKNHHQPSSDATRRRYSFHGALAYGIDVLCNLDTSTFLPWHLDTTSQEWHNNFLITSSFFKKEFASPDRPEGVIFKWISKLHLALALNDECMANSAGTVVSFRTMLPPLSCILATSITPFPKATGSIPLVKSILYHFKLSFNLFKRLRRSDVSSGGNASSFGIFWFTTGRMSFISYRLLTITSKYTSYGAWNLKMCSGWDKYMSSHGTSLQDTFWNNHLQLFMLHVQVFEKMHQTSQSAGCLARITLFMLWWTPIAQAKLPSPMVRLGWWRPSKVWGQRSFVSRCLVCLASALSGQRTSLLRLSRHQLETSHVVFCCVVLVSCVNWVALWTITLHW